MTAKKSKDTNKAATKENAKKPPKAAAAKAAPAKEKSLGELTSQLAEKLGTTKAQTKAFLEAHAAMLVDELKSSGSVTLAGIGKLKLGERAERQGRNPATGEAITIKAAKVVKFSGGKAFKDSFQ